MVKLMLCDWAKQGRVCWDDICRGCDVTLCGFDKNFYDEFMREEEGVEYRAYDDEDEAQP